MAIKKERDWYMISTNNGVVQIDFCLLDYENLSEILEFEEYRNNTIDEIIFDFRNKDNFIERKYLDKNLIFDYIRILKKVAVSEDICFAYSKTLSYEDDNIDNVDLCYLGTFKDIEEFGLDVMSKLSLEIDYSNFDNFDWRNFIIKTIGKYAHSNHHCFLKDVDK